MVSNYLHQQISTLLYSSLWILCSLLFPLIRQTQVRRGVYDRVAKPLVGALLDHCTIILPIWMLAYVFVWILGWFSNYSVLRHRGNFCVWSAYFDLKSNNFLWFLVFGDTWGLCARLCWMIRWFKFSPKLSISCNAPTKSEQFKQRDYANVFELCVQFSLRSIALASKINVS